VRGPLYLRPKSLNEALQALVEWGERGRPLAGGTDLLVRLRQGATAPAALIDIGALNELRGWTMRGEYVVVGALTTHAQIEGDSRLEHLAPALPAACREIGSAQIRNRGTLGGNLVNASPAGDTLPALYVLEAEIGLLSAGGLRWVPIEQFFTGPGQTVRRPDELLAWARFRAGTAGERAFFNKIGQRRAVRIAKASAAGRVLLADGVVEQCRIALGAVAPTVIRARAAEEYLRGKPLSPTTIRQTADLAAAAVAPITDIRSTQSYRRHVTAVLVARGLSAVASDEPDGR